MPALVSHHHFAVTALRASEPHVRQAARENTTAFRWGAQGPDILFFHRGLLSSKTTKLGHMMHKQKVARAFREMAAFAAEKHQTELLSYLLGFACHYILDRTAHPFVTYISNYRLEPVYDLTDSALHSLCEADLDAAVITNFISGEQQQYEAFRLLEFQPHVSHLIGELISYVGWKVYGLRTSAGKVESAMRSMLLAQSLLHDGEGKRLAAVRAWERIAGRPGELSCMIRPAEPLSEDCPNLTHGVWIDPQYPHVRRYDSFFDLLEEAKAPALELMGVVYDAYHKGKAVPDIFFDLNYSGVPEE